MHRAHVNCGRRTRGGGAGRLPSSNWDCPPCSAALLCGSGAGYPWPPWCPYPPPCFAAVTAVASRWASAAVSAARLGKLRPSRKQFGGWRFSVSWVHPSCLPSGPMGPALLCPVESLRAGWATFDDCGMACGSNLLAPQVHPRPSLQELVYQWQVCSALLKRWPEQASLQGEKATSGDCGRTCG